jgi:transposase
MHRSFYDRKRRQVRDLSSGPFRVLLDIEVRRIQCRQCRAVKRERVAFLADNPFYTQRFAYYVGRRCRSATIKDIAEELRLDWDAVKELDKQYMRAQLKRAGTPGPLAIGIDEISIRKGHTYRIVVSDLIRRRPLWFGGQDRSEASMDEFYRFLGEKKAKKIRLAVMDMWKVFGTSTRHHAPQAAILFDKFHVLRHLGKALDTIRKREYGRLQGKPRTFIKGQKYTFAGTPAKPHRQRQEELEAAAGGQQAPQHGVPAEGILRPALGLQQRGLGSKVLRELARAAQMAAPETLRGLR